MHLRDAVSGSTISINVNDDILWKLLSNSELIKTKIKHLGRYVAGRTVKTVDIFRLESFQDVI